MQYFALAFFMFICGSSVSSAIETNTNDDSFDDSVIANVEYPAYFKESFMDLPEDLREARASGKKGIMILFGTQGCSYCKLFADRVFSDPEMQASIQRHFDVIALEMFSDEEIIDPSGSSMRIKHFSKLEGAEFSPTVVFYDLNGSRVFRAIGYYPKDRFSRVLDYVLDEAYRTQSFPSFLVSRQKKCSKLPDNADAAVRSLSSEYTPIAKQSDTDKTKPKLVIFEKEDCEACERFHREVISSERIRSTLKQFYVQRVDIESLEPVRDPGNRLKHISTWALALGFSQVPALVFYGKNNEIVLKTDAKVGRQRMENALGYVLTEAYSRGMTYQQFARNRAIEKRRSSIYSD